MSKFVTFSFVWDGPFFTLEAYTCMAMYEACLVLFFLKKILNVLKQTNNSNNNTLQTSVGNMVLLNTLASS